jgi:hypothetical protein
MALNIGRAIRGAGKLSGRAASATAKNTGVRKAGMGMLLGGAAVAGVISGSKSLVDGAFDVAFDNPEADRAFTGGDIGPGYISSQIVGGPIGAAGKALGPVGQAAAATAAGPVAVGGGMLAGAGTIGLAGTAAAYGASHLIGKGENLAAKKLFKRGMLGSGIVAGIGGAAMLGSAYTAEKLVSKMSTSPYANRRSSKNQEDRLGASGSIVLGMQNSRRGY